MSKTFLILLLTLLFNNVHAQSLSQMEKFIYYTPTSTKAITKDDKYHLVYKAKTQTCHLYKNDKEISLFDKRFDRRKPKTPYMCSSWQKEPYRSCKQVDQDNVTALVLSYGVYQNTNFLLGLQSPHKSINASVEVICSKKRLLF